MSRNHYRVLHADYDSTGFAGSACQTAKKKHSSAGSAGLIARLAINKCYSGQGYEEWLLVDALHKLLQASDTVGFPLVIVDAKSGVAAFYEKLGFAPFIDNPDKLFITIKKIRASLR